MKAEPGHRMPSRAFRTAATRAKFSILLVSALALAVGTGIAMAQIPSPNGVIDGCYSKSTGSVPIVDSTASCKSGETSLNSNQTGPAGPAGTQGPRGPEGQRLSLVSNLQRSPHGDSPAPPTFEKRAKDPTLRREIGRRRMLTAAGALAAALAPSGTASAIPPADPPATQAGYSAAVSQICAGALLFSGAHAIGTRPGAVAVSRDIRATGTRRMRRVEAVPRPMETNARAVRWIALERRLVEMYAANYLRIWNEIEKADTPRERAALPARLVPLIQEPEPLQRHALAFERALRVPDCTGGASTGANATTTRRP